MTLGLEGHQPGEHLPCVHDVEEMKGQTPPSQVLFEGTLQLPVLDRFMLIGRR